MGWKRKNLIMIKWGENRYYRRLKSIENENKTVTDIWLDMDMDVQVNGSKIVIRTRQGSEMKNDSGLSKVMEIGTKPSQANASTVNSDSNQLNENNPIQNFLTECRFGRIQYNIGSSIMQVPDLCKGIDKDKVFNNCIKYLNRTHMMNNHHSPCVCVVCDN